MPLFRPLIALALAFGLAAAPALAAPPRQVEIQPPAGGVIKTFSRSFQVGDRYSFVSETDFEQTGNGQTRRQTNRLTFDVEIIGIEGEKLKLRYTLRAATIADTGLPDIALLEQANIGVPVEFWAYPGTTPREMANFEAVRDAYLRNLDKVAPGRGDLRKMAEEAYARLAKDPESIAGQLAGDVAVLAGMQVPAVPVGKTQIPVQHFEAGEGVMVTKTADINVERHRPERCELTFSRSTLTVAESPDGEMSEDLKTTATVSTKDSWALTLTETKVEKGGGFSSRSLVKITRQGAAPGCG